MADDLSAPLGRKAVKPKRRFAVSAVNLPLARIAFGIVALILVGVGARILLVDDPMGGRPSTEVTVKAAQGSNSIAETVASKPPGEMATITADPETPVDGPAVTIVGDDVPNGSVAGDDLQMSTDGLYPDLLEETEHGSIPRMSATGRTPFDAYSSPSLTPAGIRRQGAGRHHRHRARPQSDWNGVGDRQSARNVTLAFAPYGKDLAAVGRVGAQCRPRGAARSAARALRLSRERPRPRHPAHRPGAARQSRTSYSPCMGKFGGYVGVINHMGARFTASAADFAPDDGRARRPRARLSR